MEPSQEQVGEGPAESVRSLIPKVINHIGEQLGVTGTEGCYAASITHYTLSQFAVVFGLSSCTMEMDFSGKHQREIIGKIDDLNMMVQHIKSSARIEALVYLKEGLLELNQVPIDLKVTCDKFQRVRELVKKAITSENNFTNMIVCSKYFIFAEMVV